MKDFFKLIAVAIISIGGLARTCTKTVSSIVKIVDPLAEARFLKNSNSMEHTIYNSTKTVAYEDDVVKSTKQLKNTDKSKNDFPILNAVKNTKDVAELTDRIIKSNVVDTVKIIVKKKK